ncbi:hypothetical protein Ahy_A07g031939 [Arachis hypogaea]|uniref:Zinc knuckle CX2CX4HX4C domain-containing protein n=1 Tax=Arachis hypogaea TaxID=3818 RepID=A0A445C5G7_ARAHY|nr:hypothetical protein Ahy_A07g031939 [Arachis hypogaea]
MVNAASNPRLQPEKENTIISFDEKNVQVGSEHYEKDMLRIERGAPWLFKNYILNLRRWKEDENNVEIYFAHVPIWIKIWGLPEQFKTKELGRKIEDSFGEVLDVDIFQVRDKEHSIIKIHVNLDITKPLRRYVKLAGPKNQQLEVALKYERIGTFCNYCRFIGHETRACSFQIEDSLKGEVKEEKWGNWLKADQTGRREGATKDNPNSNLPKGEEIELTQQGQKVNSSQLN